MYNYIYICAYKRLERIILGAYITLYIDMQILMPSRFDVESQRHWKTQSSCAAGACTLHRVGQWLICFCENRAVLGLHPVSGFAFGLLMFVMSCAHDLQSPSLLMSLCVGQEVLDLLFAR